MLIQTRTAHVSLNGFLAKIGVLEFESQCPCGHGTDARDLVSLHCGLYEGLWSIVLPAKSRETNINVLVEDPTRVVSTTDFIMKTGRLQQFRRYQMDKDATK